MKKASFLLGLCLVVIMGTLWMPRSSYATPSESWFAAVYKDISTIVEYSFEVEFSPSPRNFFQNSETSCPYGGCDMDSTSTYETECQLGVKLVLGKLTVQSGSDKQEKAVWADVIFKRHRNEHVGYSDNCEIYTDVQLKSFYEQSYQNHANLHDVSWTVDWNDHRLQGKTNLVINKNGFIQAQSTTIQMVDDWQRYRDGTDAFPLSQSPEIARSSLRDRGNPYQSDPAENDY